MEAGGLVPDAIINRIVADRIDQPDAAGGSSSTATRGP